MKRIYFVGIYAIFHMIFLWMGNVLMFIQLKNDWTFFVFVIVYLLSIMMFYSKQKPTPVEPKDFLFAIIACGVTYLLWSQQYPFEQLAYQFTNLILTTISFGCAIRYQQLLSN